MNATAMIRRHSNEDVAEGRFDPLTMVESSECPPREGLLPVAVRERAFLPTDLVLLFRLAGMSMLNIRLKLAIFKKKVLALKNSIPIVFHADHLPAPFCSHFKPFIQRSDTEIIIVGVLADRIVMVV
jgi:hypothetical protein